MIKKKKKEELFHNIQLLRCAACCYMFNSLVELPEHGGGVGLVYKSGQRILNNVTSTVIVVFPGAGENNGKVSIFRQTDKRANSSNFHDPSPFIDRTKNSNETLIRYRGSCEVTNSIYALFIYL